MIMKGVDEHITDIFCHSSLEPLIEKTIKKNNSKEEANGQEETNQLEILPNSVEVCDKCLKSESEEELCRPRPNLNTKGDKGCDEDSIPSILAMKNAVCLLDPKT